MSAADAEQLLGARELPHQDWAETSINLGPPRGTQPKSGDFFFYFLGGDFSSADLAAAAASAPPVDVHHLILASHSVLPSQGSCQRRPWEEKIPLTPPTGRDLVHI